MGAITDESGEEFAKGWRVLRKCLVEPIPEIFEAAFQLDEAVIAHLDGKSELAKQLIRCTNTDKIRAWTESVWGHQHGKMRVDPPFLSKDHRPMPRNPDAALQRKMLEDNKGYHCRFCSIPLIRQEVRAHLGALYPEDLPWGSTNMTQHAAFQAMWLQYDHVFPNARGGETAADNMVVTCAPCNFGRMSCTLDEVGLVDPRNRDPIRSSWDGLERVLRTPV